MDVQSPINISPDFVDWFNLRWNPEMGAIDGKDVSFIAALISDLRPRNVVEIGCASGLSTAVLAALLERVGGATVNSFDIDDRFYMDRSKPVGFLIHEALAHPSVEVTVNTHKTSLDVATVVKEPIEFCFIDAAHKHPWPLIDTLAVLPYMKAGGVIVHHDLQMFKSDGFYATGPKILLDQTPSDAEIRSWSVPKTRNAEKLKSRAFDNNIYAIRVPGDFEALGNRLSQGFYVGWDNDPSKRVPRAFSHEFVRLVRQSYKPMAGRAFEVGLRRYNPQQDQPHPLARKVADYVLGRSNS